MIKFLHTADLHLDAPFAALSPEQAAARRQEQRELLTELAEAANTHDCDLVLLAGDLFDSAGASDETLLALRRALASIRAPVFISPGNHDCLLPGSAYLTERWPENVHIFKTDAIEAVELPEKQLRVYGAGFTARHERPLLEGFRAKADGWTNLMVLHGDATQAASPYNPITPEQLAASGLAYLALGHIHQASGLLRCGSTCYAWPGCAMGRGFDELGQKGAYLGEVSDSGVRLDFLPLHGRSYEILRVEAGDDALAAVTAALPEDTQNDIYRVILTGEAEPVETAALQAALAPRFYALTIRDETRPRRALWEGAEEDTLRGLFLQALKSRWPRAAAARRWMEGRRRNEASAHDRNIRQARAGDALAYRGPERPANAERGRKEHLGGIFAGHALWRRYL